MLKITYKLLERYHAKKRRKPVRRGYCQVCGSKLSDERSIERGIGKHCLASNIVLEMIPDNLPNPRVQADACHECGNRFGVHEIYCSKWLAS